MKCEECLLIIEEYVDGDLEAQETGRVAVHIAGCQTCSTICEDLRQEQEIYIHYKRDVEVTPALWLGIKERIEDERVIHSSSPIAFLREWFTRIFSAPRLSPALAAALVLVAVGFTVGVMKFMGPNGAAPTVSKKDDSAAPPAQSGPDQGTKKNEVASNENNGPVKTDGGEGVARKTEDGFNQPHIPPVKSAQNGPKRANYQSRITSAPTPDELVRQAEEKYLAAIDILSRDVKKRREQLDSTSIEQFELALATIDQTIADTRKAVQKYPGDPVAVQYLMTAYAKKVEVLREMAGY
jgi:hypothetical protein